MYFNENVSEKHAFQTWCSAHTNSQNEIFNVTPDTDQTPELTQQVPRSVTVWTMFTKKLKTKKLKDHSLNIHFSRVYKEKPMKRACNMIQSKQYYKVENGRRYLGQESPVQI